MRVRKFPGYTVGVTGGIGSGKSAVCEILQGLGRVVIAADPLARELMETDGLLRDRLEGVLGDEIFQTNGRLDRHRVSAMIFSNRSLRELVNRIVHPKVAEAIEERLLALPKGKRFPYVVIEAALIYESGLERRLDSVVVVDADLETRLKRVVERDGVGREEILKRVRAQMSVREKVRRADIVIRNTHDMASLAEKVRFVDALLTSLRQKKKPSV